MKFKHIPAWGFGSAKKCEIEKTDILTNPGPGNYAPKSYREGPTWRIGSALRISKNKNNNPGPGQYNIPTKLFNGPKYSMATKLGPNELSKSSIVPGPGKYNINFTDRTSSAKYTMRSKPSPKKKEITPGPGNYNLRKDTINVPSYKFGHEGKKGLEYVNTRYVPGPGNYDYNADILHEKNPKFSFGKEIRRVIKRYKTPGPGQYEYKNYIGKEGPKITISGKLDSNYFIGDRKYVPGPGQYNTTDINSYRLKNPIYRIGTAKRNALYKSQEYPGPGQYASNKYINNVRKKNPSWKIGTEKRPELNHSDRSIPGVGNYNISKGLGEGPKFSILGRYNKIKIINNNPGPGQYNDSYVITKIKNPSWKIGTGKRDDALKRIKREGIPGPGMYNYEDKTKLKAPTYGFGREKRENIIKNDVPGPGQYRIPCSFDDVNNYTREKGNFDKNFQFI